MNAPALEVEAEKAKPSLADRVDEVEQGLSAALADYRKQAEDVLLKHLEHMESAESQHQLEVATLRAENCALREKCGFGNVTIQNILYQANDHESPKGKGLRRQKTVPRKSEVFNKKKGDEDESALAHLDARKGRGKGAFPASGQGSWQNFVAWVPTGSGLKNAEPWKPLPNEKLLTPIAAKSPHGSHHLTGVVPGSVDEEIKSEHSSHGSDSEHGHREKRHYEVLDMWKASRSSLDKSRKNSASDGESRYTKEQSSYDNSEEKVEFIQETPKCWISHPHSRRRVVWDVMSLFMVLYDFIVVPMTVFGLPKNNPLLVTMDWSTRVFWTIDIWWSFTTGHVLGDGTVEFNPCFIAKRYMKTWLPLDTVIVGVDWVLVIVERGTINIAKITRVVRIVRVVRLLRLVRMQEIIAQITERIQSDNMSLAVSIMKLLAFVVSTSHISACCWWGIGDRDGATWVSAEDMGDSDLETKYLACLYWSLAQYAGGSREISPVSIGERLYAIAVWLFAFAASAIIISTLTSKLTQLYIIGGAQSRQISTLRKYLSQNNISSNLALRVQRSAQHAVNGDLTQESVELLSVVSEPLKIEMHFAMYSNVMRCHPFFCDFVHAGPHLMRRVCHYAMSTLILTPGEVVFNKGEEPQDPKMYFIWKGCTSYSHCYNDDVLCRDRAWVSEAVLWTRWRHRGNLTATTETKVAMLDATLFQNLTRKFKEGHLDPKVYAADFVDLLNKTEDVDDLTSVCARY